MKRRGGMAFITPWYHPPDIFKTFHPPPPLHRLIGLLSLTFNDPFTPKSDQDIIPPSNFKTISTTQVMRKQENVNTRRLFSDPAPNSQNQNYEKCVVDNKLRFGFKRRNKHFSCILSPLT